MIAYDTFELANGLRVAHCQDKEAVLTVVDVLYDTGARDESPEMTGIAHLFEHLMFGGSPHVKSFDDVLQAAGGTSNAFTSNDFTEFYDIVPTQNVETAFYLESDRMLDIDLSQKAVDVQKSVVIEEFKEVCLNRPYGKVMHSLRPMLYQSHPYRWPVIGVDPSHIEKVARADALRWHQSHYAPNNAILTVVGNISLGRAQELAQKWFGGLPRRQVAPRRLADDPWPCEPRSLTIYDDVPQTMILIAYRMDPYGSKGYLAADAISDILAAGKSSRLPQRLVLGTKLFTSASASITGNEHSGMFIVDAQLAVEDAQAVDQAVEMLLAECRQLAEPGNVAPYELLRTKNRYESNFTFENLSTLARAQNLALAVMHGEDINQAVPRYRALELDDIAATARKLFVDHAPAVLICRPQAARGEDAPQA